MRFLSLNMTRTLQSQLQSVEHVVDEMESEMKIEFEVYSSQVSPEFVVRFVEVD